MTSPPSSAALRVESVEMLTTACCDDAIIHFQLAIVGVTALGCCQSATRDFIRSSSATGLPSASQQPPCCACGVIVRLLWPMQPQLPLRRRRLRRLHRKRRARRPQQPHLQMYQCAESAGARQTPTRTACCWNRAAALEARATFTSAASLRGWRAWRAARASIGRAFATSARRPTGAGSRLPLVVARHWMLCLLPPHSTPPLAPLDPLAPHLIAAFPKTCC